MAKTYVTFGQDHVHYVNGKTFDCDCVAVINHKDSNGRELAFEIFGLQFCMEYPEKRFDHSSMHYYPRGLIEVFDETL